MRFLEMVIFLSSFLFNAAIESSSLEAINMVQALVSQNPDIQKVLAFESGFEKLFDIVTQEGGVDGGPVAQGALTCVDNLLRFNSSNQVLTNQFAIS